MPLRLMLLLLSLLPFFDGGSGGGGDDDPPGDRDDDNDQGDPDDDEKLGAKGRDALKRERDARKAAERERTALQKRIDDLEQAQKAREDADAKAKGEWEKVAKDREAELETLKAELAERDRNDLKRTIAAETGLPGDLALRLTGDDEAALREDAKELAKHLKAREVETDAGERTPNGNKKPTRSEFANPARWGLRR